MFFVALPDSLKDVLGHVFSKADFTISDVKKMWREK